MQSREGKNARATCTLQYTTPHSAHWSGEGACTAFLLHAARPLFTLTLQYMHTFHLQLRTVIRPNRTLLLAYISFRTSFFISCFVRRAEIASRLIDCFVSVFVLFSSSDVKAPNARSTCPRRSYPRRSRGSCAASLRGSAPCSICEFSPEATAGRWSKHGTVTVCRTRTHSLRRLFLPSHTLSAAAAAAMLAAATELHQHSCMPLICRRTAQTAPCLRSRLHWTYNLSLRLHHLRLHRPTRRLLLYCRRSVHTYSLRRSLCHDLCRSRVHSLACSSARNTFCCFFL